MTTAPRTPTPRRRGPHPPATLVTAAALVLTLVATLAATLAPVVVPGLASPAAAETTAVPGTLGLGSATAGVVRLEVPPGIMPTSLGGRLTVAADAPDDDVTVVVGRDRVAATLPAETADVTVPVSRDDVVDGVLSVRLGLAASEACPTTDADAPVTLTDLTLDSTGEELAPVDLADFWPASSSRIDVVVPGKADDALLETGLNAVAALSRRYGPDTPVVLSSASTQLPRTGFGQRVLRLETGAGPVVPTLEDQFGLPELDLTGDVDELRAAVRTLAYGDDLVTPLPEDPEPALRRTFADLGAEQVSISGPSGGVGTVRVPQDAFGEQVGAIRVRAEGTRTALPDDTDPEAALPTLDTYVNDVLVDSQPLDPDDPAVAVDATADAELLRPTNTVRFALGAGSTDTTGATDGTCPAVLPGVGVTLDGGTATVDATPADETGADELGLAAYPQNLGGELTVAVRPEGGLRVGAAGDAAAVVSALQGAVAGLLDVTVVEADDLVDGEGDGLLVGADLDDAEALDTPLQYAEVPDPDRPAPDGVDVTQLFAALETAGTDARDVLVLGSFGPGDRESQTELRATTARAAATLGWADLDGDLLVTTRDGEPTVLDVPAAAPAAADDDGGSGLAAGWLAAAVVALLLLLGLQVRRGVRLDRRSRDTGDDVTA